MTIAADIHRPSRFHDREEHQPVKPVSVSPRVLKAARLFTWKSPGKVHTRPQCHLPWAMRRNGCNLLVSTDGHTLLLVNDVDGAAYPRKPRQVGGKPASTEMPDWPKVVRALRRPYKQNNAIKIFAAYHARIMRAAAILDVDAIHIRTRGLADPVSYQLGAHAYALCMPRRLDGITLPPLPLWVDQVTGDAT